MDFERFVADLTDAEAELAGREQDLSDQLKVVQRDLRKVRDAKTCIAGGRTTKGSRKPAPRKRDVKTTVELLLRQQGVVPEETLRGLVESTLAEQGKSKQGLVLRLNEVLQSDGFEKIPSGWRIKDDAHQSGEEEVS